MEGGRAAWFRLFHIYVGLLQLYLDYQVEIIGWLSEFVPHNIFERFTNAVDLWAA